MTITGHFERFQYFNFESNFLKNENVFKKTGSLFRYETALSEANVKKNEMGSTKWTYQKKGSFASNSLFLFCFWKFCFSLKTSYKELIWCINNLNIHIHTFCKRWNFIWDKVFKSRLSKFCFKFFKGFHPQNYLSPFWNTLSYLTLLFPCEHLKPYFHFH